MKKSNDGNIIRDAAKLVVFLGILFGFLTWGILKPDDRISKAERRPLTMPPELSLANVKKGTYMKDFEQYALDQFPMREVFRGLKTYMNLFVYHMNDTNGIYLVKDNISKLEYKINDESVSYALKRFEYIYDTFLAGKNTNVYFSVIPDKGYFLSKKNGYPSMDYDELVEKLEDGFSYAKYIDIIKMLDESDYYNTDTHWRQEKILDVAIALSNAMGANISKNYNCKVVETPFYGVYYGQLALPVAPDEMCYIESEELSYVRVYDYETSSYIPMYDMGATKTWDAYEMFLGGAKSLLRIENPAAPADKKLVIFRDSFTSSLAPYLATGYSEIMLVDIRYITPKLLEKFIDFDGQDVLYLYSGLVLNNSETIK